MLNNKDLRAVDSGIYASIHASKMPDLNAQKLINGINNNERDLEDNLKTTMQAVRNSDEYWSKISSKLYSTNMHFGPGTFFGTLSIAEYAWVNLKVFIQTMNKDVANIEKLSLDELIELDPASVSLFFDRKFHSFWSNFTWNFQGPFGEVLADYWRREYQARGCPHIHFKLWVKNAPIYGVDPNSEVIKFIDKHLTCRIPDPKLEPKLYELVMKYQIHKCSSSCQRIVFRKNCSRKICRY
jgi:hypothetical protein